jgi:hypothetical protein
LILLAIDLQILRSLRRENLTYAVIYVISGLERLRSSSRYCKGMLRIIYRRAAGLPVRTSSLQARTLATASAAQKIKPEGDISSVFVSLSGGKAPPLPDRFARLKKQLLLGHEDQLKASWDRLLEELQNEIEVVKERGPAVIPEINFKDINAAPESFQKELHKRGAAVVRGIVSEDEALQYKSDIQKYIKANPSTKGFYYCDFRKYLC